MVNSYGDESAPSLPASVTTDISCNQRILDLVYAPAAGEAPMAKKRIYRLATGENGNSDYLFVAEIDGGLTEFTDNRLDVELAESLPSLNWRQPDWTAPCRVPPRRGPCGTYCGWRLPLGIL